MANTKLNYDSSLRSNDDIDNQELEHFLEQKNNANKNNRFSHEVASNTIIDSLAKEWWSKKMPNCVINDLIEDLIPLLVLGCEKVVKEADERNLINTNAPDRQFNPVNYLAQYLMRNNPKYLRYAQTSPYRYAMKQLHEHCKVEVLKVFGEEETLLHDLLKKRQTDRMANRETTTSEDSRRRDLLKSAFHDWNVNERGWIETKLIKNMLEQTNDYYQHHSTEENIQLEVNPNHQAFHSHRMHIDSFTEGFLEILRSVPHDLFNNILALFSKCAKQYRDQVDEHEIDLLFQRLFKILDDKHIGYLFRSNVMKTLDTFYNSIDPDNRVKVNEPDKWPVVKPVLFQQKTDENRKKSSISTPDIDIDGTKTPDDNNRVKSDDRNTNSEKTDQVTIEQQENENEKSQHGSSANTLDDENDQQTRTDTNTSPYLDLKDVNAYDPQFRYSKIKEATNNLESLTFLSKNESFPFHERLINEEQFCALLKAFIGNEKDELTTTALVDFFKTLYNETPEEKTDKKDSIIQRERERQMRVAADTLFDKIDNTTLGSIKFEPIATILKEYKDESVLEYIQPILDAYKENQSLTKTQFYDILVRIHKIVHATQEETFDQLLKFIENRQPINRNERDRADLRHQWLKKLRDIPYRTLNVLYKEVIDTLKKDAETFGGQKCINAYIALLERNTEKTQNSIRYVATTADNADLLLGQTLTRGQGISFQVMDSGKPTYISQTKNNSRIHFFDENVKSNNGSFVLIPLKRTVRAKCNGCLGIDTVRDKKEKAFSNDEIQFYQAVALAFSETFGYVEFDDYMNTVISRASYWMNVRCTSIVTMDYYTYEPLTMSNPKERLLRHVMTNSNQKMTIVNEPSTIDIKEQIFKYRLEHAASICQPTITTFLDETHLIQPLHGRDGYCFALLDVNIGENKSLPLDQNIVFMQLCRLIYFAVYELEEEIVDGTSQRYLYCEQHFDENRIKFLFDRLWYRDLCDRLVTMPLESVREVIDNSTISDDMKKLLNIIGNLVMGKNNFTVKDVTNNNLFSNMSNFDPTIKNDKHTDTWNKAENILKSINSALLIQSEVPIAIIMYDWLNVSLTLYKMTKVQEEMQ
ncbi:unnamed protein product [Didymodactylos carnosus]|uniref:Uncharacterized protein n=1 Tax=Didymodactylos carnosus TaxID=1234261 RepID=A0A813TDN4_9BILA|nr:unnamed protein product [Didymodactylos carnosus]CAF0807849.1 unnamed protein product [Didymodactylos carnosus]CAF3549959.1 unnamed protein product [Didymodactylos carnosus]CAF3593375.1 unnamed protein product [Didymodactylos carnosus]